MLVLLTLLITTAFALDENCSATAISKEWFPPLNPAHGLIDYNTTNPPGWGACLAYSRATCCEKNQTDAVFRMLVGMERAGFSSECKEVTERVLCSISCNPDVGLGKLPPLICSSTCSDWFAACKNEFISPAQASIQKIPVPCSDAATVCSRIGLIYPTGGEFCDAMSVRWAAGEGECLTGRVDVERRGKPLPGPKSPNRNTGTPTWIDMFMRDVRMLQSFMKKYGDTYFKSVDRFVGKYATYLQWAGGVTVIFIATPLILRGIKGKQRDQQDQQNDDFDK